MLLAMTDDVRVMLVKLADRLHNMRTIDALRPDQRRRIARETLEIYAPIAIRLGLNQLKEELEDLGLKALFPNRYKVIQAELRRTRGDRKRAVKKRPDRDPAPPPAGGGWRRRCSVAKSTSTASIRRCAPSGCP